ncbi:hypothetical protein ACWEV3_00385 [Saccharopolyspora sp. NPDC003752]
MATVVAGLAIMLGAGGVAFASTTNSPANESKQATAIECQPAEVLPPGTPTVPAVPADDVSIPSLPGEPIECQPAEVLPPGTPTVPAKPADDVSTAPIELDK